MRLFPVVLPVTNDLLSPRGREKVALLSSCARQALRLSATKAGVSLEDMSKDGDDVPIPSGGCYWSVSHKPKYVAAVISGDPTGIDIEEIKPRSPSIFGYVASDEEWELCGGRSWDTLYRYWTAKEAVVKAAGTGLSGMRSCQVVSVPDGTHILLYYHNRLRTVEQLRYDSHIVAVLRDDNKVKWTIPGEHSSPTLTDGPGSQGQQYHEPFEPTR